MHGIPHPHCMITPARSNVLPIGGPGHGEYLTVMAKVGEDAPSSSDIPNPDCCIIAGRGNVLPIRGPRYGTNNIAMTTTGRENKATRGCDVTSYGRNRRKMGYTRRQYSGRRLRDCSRLLRWESCGLETMALPGCDMLEFSFNA